MEDILLFCKSKDFKYLKSRVIFSQKDIIIPYTKIKTYNTFSSTCLNNICTDFHKQFERIGITYEYSTKHLDIDSYNHIKLDWFNLQAHFIKSLNSDEILTLMGYTELSFSVVNSWCTNDDWWTILKEVIKGIRSSDYFPFFYQVLLVSQNFDFTKHHREIIDNFFNYKLDSQKYEHFMKIRHKMLGSMWKTFWNDVVSEYVDNLDQIIKRAPKTTSYMTVWRVTNTPFWNTDSNDSTTINSFTSTSLDINTAIESLKKSCCITRIIIPKGIRCLFLGMLSPFCEAEILIGRNSIFTKDPGCMDDISLPYKIRGEDKNINIEYRLCSKLDTIETAILNFKGYTQ